MMPDWLPERHGSAATRRFRLWCGRHHVMVADNRNRAARALASCWAPALMTGDLDIGALRVLVTAAAEGRGT
jgi:hypothetical protein